MKKVLFLISFLFAVVCYAAPPPDVGFMSFDENESSMLQVVASIETPVFTVEAQEVAFVNVGNCDLITGIQFNLNVFATSKDVTGLPVKISDDIGYLGLNGPPLYNSIYAGIINNGSGFKMDKQNSNYGYPMTAG